MRVEKTRATSMFCQVLPIKVTFHCKINWLATLQFKEVLRENEDGKHISGSGETSKDNGRQMKGQVEVTRELKTRRLDQILFSYMFYFYFEFINYDFCLTCMSFFSLCSGQLWLFLQLVV